MTVRKSVVIVLIVAVIVALIWVTVSRNRRQPIIQFYADLPMDDVPFIKNTYPRMLKQIDQGDRHARISYAHFVLVARLTQAQSEFLVHDIVSMNQTSDTTDRKAAVQIISNGHVLDMIPELEKRYHSEASPEVRGEILLVYGWLGIDPDFDLVMKESYSSNATVKEAAFQALQLYKDTSKTLLSRQKVDLQHRLDAYARNTNKVH